MGIVLLDHCEGNQICNNCGRVLESHMISDEQEWRSFNTESSGGAGSDRNRVGEALDHWTESQVSATTFLGGGKRLQQIQESTSVSNQQDRLLRQAFVQLRSIAECFGLQEHTMERAKEIAKDLQLAGHLKGRCNTLNMLAVTYLACREASLFRTVKELIVYDRSLTERDLARSINKLKKFLPHRGAAFFESASQLLDRFCSRLSLSTNLCSVAEHAVEKACNIVTTAHRPTSMAAGVLFLIVQIFTLEGSDEKMPSISDIARVCSVGEHTVRRTFRELLPIATRILPANFQSQHYEGIQRVLELKK